MEKPPLRARGLSGRAASVAVAVFAATNCGAEVTFEWTPISSPEEVRFEGACTVWEGEVYLLGGFLDDAKATSSVDAYDPVSDRWTRKADMPQPVTHVGLAELNDRIYLAGGYVGDHPGPATDAVWSYDPREDRWRPETALPSPRSGGALVAVGATLHYVGGVGSEPESDLESHWVLQPGATGRASEQWGESVPWARARNHIGVVALGNRILLLGGQAGHFHGPQIQELDLVDAFDVSTGAWHELAPLPMPLSHFEPAVVTDGPKVYVFGGRSYPRDSDEVLLYDGEVDRWSVVGRLPESRRGSCAVRVGETLYFVGGAQGVKAVRQSWRAPWPWAPAGQTTD